MDQNHSPTDQPVGDKAATIRIARVGTFTSNEGVQVSFGAADLAAAAAAYDPKDDPAPLVVGHPRLDDPAYGWVSGLSVQDGELVATPDKVEPSFAEMVREGRFPKVSARFYPPTHPSNPKPGAWYLKHVGFLGAHAPGIKGLGTVQFAAGDDDGVLSIDIATAGAGTNDGEIISQQQEAALAEDKLASFAERENALETREADIAAREKALADKAKADRHDAHVSFAEGLVSQAKLAPAGKQIVIGLLDHFDATAMVSFGEVGEMDAATALRKLLDTASPLISFGEVGGKPEGEQSYTSFAAPEGYDVEPEAAALHAAATKIQQGNPELAWMDCVRRAKAAGG